jgi:hypothetical protein
VGHELDIDMFQSLGPAPFYRIDNGRTVAVPYPVPPLRLRWSG